HACCPTTSLGSDCYSPIARHLTIQPALLCPATSTGDACLQLRVGVGRLHWHIINPRGERIAAALFILNGPCVFFCELLYDLDNFLVIFRCAHDDEGIAVILQTNNATDLGFSQHLLELLSRNPRDGNHRRTRRGTKERKRE